MTDAILLESPTGDQNASKYSKSCFRSRGSRLVFFRSNEVRSVAFGGSGAHLSLTFVVAAALLDKSCDAPIMKQLNYDIRLQAPEVVYPRSKPNGSSRLGHFRHIDRANPDEVLALREPSYLENCVLTERFSVRHHKKVLEIIC
jgi:hypothetical protein